MPLKDFEQQEFDEYGIQKEDRVHGAYYYGHCRNARVARWNADDNQFYYIRTKFGSSFVESLPGPEDAHERMDYFMPGGLVERPKHEIDWDQDTRKRFRWDGK